MIKLEDDNFFWSLIIFIIHLVYSKNLLTVVHKVLSTDPWGPQDTFWLGQNIFMIILRP